MRTAQICPTCATYTNAVCTLYNGPYLSCIGVSPLDSLEKALGLINGSVCLNNAQITTINNTLANMDLQAVTDIGAITTNQITVGGITSNGDISIPDNFLLSFEDDTTNFYGNISVNPNTLTADRNYYLPNATGTLVLNVNGITADVNGKIELYKEWVGQITQNLTSAPTVYNQFADTLANPMTFRYDGVGIYSLICADFDQTHTWATVQMGFVVGDASIQIAFYPGYIQLYTYIGGVLTDTAMGAASIEIRVYP